MNKILLKTSISFILVLLLVVSLQASEDDADIPSEEQMQQMMALMMPGENHKVLDSLVGTWDYSMSHRMTPEAPMEITSGMSEIEWILNGRQLKQKVSGTIEMNGETHNFEGIGLIGFDNMKGEYTSIWIDNVGTGTMVSTGAYDPESNTITEKGSHMCPIQGKEISFRSEVKFGDENHFTYTMYDLNSYDKPFKSMEIEYTRK